MGAAPDPDGATQVAAPDHSGEPISGAIVCAACG
jgi:hypothetical protein